MIQRISKIKGIKTVGAMAGGDSTMNLMGGGNDSVSMYILLDEDSKVKASDVEEKIVSRTKDLDCKVETNSSSMDYSSYFGSGLSVRIKGNDIDTLQKLAKEVADVMKQTKGTVDVDDGLEDTKPQLTIPWTKKKLRNTDTRLHRYISLSVRRWQTARAQPRFPQTSKIIKSMCRHRNRRIRNWTISDR